MSAASFIRKAALRQCSFCVIRLNALMH